MKKDMLSQWEEFSNSFFAKNGAYISFEISYKYREVLFLKKLISYPLKLNKKYCCKDWSVNMFPWSRVLRCITPSCYAILIIISNEDNYIYSLYELGT